MNRVNVIITFEARAESLSAFAAIMHQVKRDLPSVNGCHRVRLFCSNDNPCIFTLLEEWESKSHHTAHIEKAVSSGAWESIAAHLSADPVSRYYQEL